MNSEDYKNKIKDSLEEILENLDDNYYCMETELRKEILDKKEKEVKINEEIKHIYSMLSNEMCIKLIKKILPLKVRLFNKIRWSGTGITGIDSITIWFCFGDWGYSFSHPFNLKEIKQLLKIK